MLPGEINTPKQREEQEFFESNPSRLKRVLVYFLGGVTYAEIAAIRWLNTSHPRLAGRFKFVIATTSIISSKKCM